MWIQTDIDELKLAVKSGILRVSYSGPPARLVEYQSLKEMRVLLAEMQSDVSIAAGGSSYRLVSTRKGFGRGRYDQE